MFSLTVSVTQDVFIAALNCRSYAETSCELERLTQKTRTSLDYVSSLRHSNAIMPVIMLVNISWQRRASLLCYANTTQDRGRKEWSPDPKAAICLGKKTQLFFYWRNDRPTKNSDQLGAKVCSTVLCQTYTR